MELNVQKHLQKFSKVKLPKRNKGENAHEQQI